MMYRNFNQGFNSNGLCPHVGYFNSGWRLIIGMGLILTIALLFYIFIRNNKKRVSSDAFEILKLQYVKGEISEEEYIRRKSVIDC